MSVYYCNYCTYFSNRKYNLTKHINNKHTDIIINEKSVKNVNPNVKNVSPEKTKDTEDEDNLCCKCNKKYSSKRYLNKHEEKCKGIDGLTCLKCMVSFTTRAAKSRHIKRDSCKPRSIIHAREPKSQNVCDTKIINIQTQNNIQNNNLIINNFGNERTDHITHQDIVKILMSGINTLPMYIEKKHFDKKFPENNNIVYTKENKCKVLEDNCWKEKDIGLLSSKLIQDNTQVLLLYCNKNEIKLSEEIMNDDLLESIKNKLIIIYNKSDNEKYNKIVNLLKDILKNSKE